MVLRRKSVGYYKPLSRRRGRPFKKGASFPRYTFFLRSFADRQAAMYGIEMGIVALQRQYVGSRKKLRWIISAASSVIARSKEV